ncbi:MAG: hypothetical protein AB8B97_04055 [Granulosicoccus sp.]
MGDNILDDVDDCPLVVNTDQANFDNDPAGDICDEDDDNDGFPDAIDLDPFNPNVSEGIEVTISRTILSSADDVELRVVRPGRGTRVAVDSNDLELGLDQGSNGFKTNVGLQFADLAIPQGAIIRDARVLFWVDEPTDEDTSLTLQGLDEDDARTLGNSRTSASVNWSPPPWTVRGTAPVEQTQSPDLSAIVQEIVDRSGWQAGNALSLQIDGSGRRVAYSNDQSSGRKAPMLTDRYYTEEGNQTPSVQLGPDVEILQSDSLTLNGQVQDDGLPVSPGATSVRWSKLSGPGSIEIDDQDSTMPTLTFSRSGRYELELRVFDGALTGLDRIIVTVTENNNTGENVIERRIASSTDDAEEELTRTGDAGPVDLGSSDPELPFESTPQTIGLRFTDLAIPPGATITRAWVQFTVDEIRPSNLAPIELAIHGENTADARSFEENIGNVSNRPRTQTSVNWSPPFWERINDVGDAQRTPDLSSIVQEIVNEANGWQSGNALVLVISNTQSLQPNSIGTGQRIAGSFDGEKNSAPLLHIEYEYRLFCAGLIYMPRGSWRVKSSKPCFAGSWVCGNMLRRITPAGNSR